MMIKTIGLHIHLLLNMDISIPKETIYKIDKEYDKTYLYTTLTENEILASGKDDPFYTSMRSYTGD